MKSGKQRRAELDAKRIARVAKATAREILRRQAIGGVPVNRGALAPNNSYGEAEFVTRGYYSDRPFACIDCGQSEIWTAAQQKWWYEVAKGDVFTTARRCRACRRKERERRTDARRVHLEGIARKQRQV